MRRKELFLAALTFSICLLSAAAAHGENEIFEVRATEVDSMVFTHGKIGKNPDQSKVVYLVNLPAKTVKRTAVYNKNLARALLHGFQETDSKVYQIVSNDKDPDLDQRLIRAVGERGTAGGYETVVIGENFVTTARAAADYCMVADYERTDSEQARVRDATGREVGN